MNEREIAIRIEEMAHEIAKIVSKGKSVEIFKVNADTLRFSEVKKKVIE